VTVEGPNPEHVHGLMGPRLDEEGVPLLGDDGAEHDPAPAPVAPAETVETAADDEPGPGATGSKRLLAVVCIGLAVLSVAMGVLAAVLASRLDHERSDRRAVQDVSGRFAAALLTYDYTDLNQAKSRVLALSTRKFQKEYSDAFTGGLEVLVKETKTRSAGTVTDVFLGNISGGAATTIAVVNAVSQGTAGRNQLVSSYIELELVKLAGTWKVDNVTNLNFGQAAGALPGVGTASTTTSSTTATTAPK
jgi:hypothetical protein